MNKIVLKLNNKLIKVDVISFADRLKWEDVLTHEGTDDDWEILSISGTPLYVAYQQCSPYGAI